MKKILKYLFMSVATVLLVACGGGTTGESESKSEGQAKDTVVRNDIVIASQAEPVGFNPLRTNDRVSANVNQQIYETLFVRSFDGKSYNPQLVDSYDTPDDTTWVLNLKEGVKFHDGTDFNAGAVKYTFERIMDPDYGSARASLVESIEKINAVSEYVVEIKTKFPDGVLVAKLAHAAGAIVSPTAEANQDLMKQPVGTGPYKFVEYTSGSHVVLESNEDYWGGAPEIKDVRIEIVPEISTIISKLETGEVDFFSGVTADHVSRVKNMQNVDLVAEPSGRVHYVGVRAYSSKSGTTEDINARRAIKYAIDSEGFASTQNGLAVPTHSLLGPKVFGYTDESESYGYRYDMEKAKSIVAKNNFADSPINILTTNQGNYSEIAEFVQASLLEAGFKKVNIEVLEYGAYLSESKNPNRMDLFTLGWSNLTGDGSELFYPNWHSNNIGGGDRSYYQNADFEEIVMESKQTLDMDKRLKALDKANEAILKDVGVIPLYHGFNVYAFADDLTDVFMDPGANYFLKTFKRR